ncbi:hypothetical protein WJX74_003369 [Apatococcus lobatus]|uniref:Uncharacterized protein n=2 Tax=Apatococcus TaxID=904362 RepID=A0AAW1T313_9CHLO
MRRCRPTCADPTPRWTTSRPVGCSACTPSTSADPGAATRTPERPGRVTGTRKMRGGGKDPGAEAGMACLEMMGVQDGLSQTFRFHRMAPGRYQHDSAYAAQYKCDGRSAVLQVFLFEEGGRLLRDFRLRFGLDQVTDELVTCMPCEGVEVDCYVLDCTESSDGEEGSNGSECRVVEVEELRIGSSVFGRQEDHGHHDARAEAA